MPEDDNKTCKIASMQTVTCIFLVSSRVVEAIMRNLSVKLFWIWTSGSGWNVIKDISYLELWQPLWSVEWNHLRHFGRMHHGETIMCNYFEFGPVVQHDNWASAWDFQQFDILTCVDSDEPVQPPFKLRYPKWCSVSSLTTIECSSD